VKNLIGGEATQIDFLTPQCSFLIVSVWQPLPGEIPMPGVGSDTCARILERLELKAGFWQADRTSVFQEALPVGRYEVRHPAPLPHVPVQPEATVHRVDHPITTLRELDVICSA
jgi:hypothetical protein